MGPAKLTPTLFFLRPAREYGTAVAAPAAGGVACFCSAAAARTTASLARVRTALSCSVLFCSALQLQGLCTGLGLGWMDLCVLLSGPLLPFSGERPAQGWTYCRVVHGGGGGRWHWPGVLPVTARASWWYVPRSVVVGEAGRPYRRGLSYNKHAQGSRQGGFLNEFFCDGWMDACIEPKVVVVVAVGDWDRDRDRKSQQ